MILALVLLAYVALICDLALFQFPAKQRPAPNLVPLRSIAHDLSSGSRRALVVNFVGNIVAFLPMGALPPLIFRSRTRLWHVLLFSLALSLTIEVSQYASGRRVPDVDDLILNTLGGAIGYRLANHRAAHGAPSAEA
jgi:glycopeptide antibiotics resistance protein